MKTEAVMCMAFTRQRPSSTPLFCTRSATVSVMFTKRRRLGTSNQRCCVRLFMRALCQTGWTTSTLNRGPTGAPGIATRAWVWEPYLDINRLVYEEKIRRHRLAKLRKQAEELG